MSVDAATASVAHEISQPLGAMTLNISSALQYLKKTPPNVEEANACLTAMADESNHANEIVRSIRKLFKTTAHQMTPIEINRLVQQVLRMVEKRPACSGSNCFNRISRRPSANNRTLLQQVILTSPSSLPRPQSSSAGHDPRRTQSSRSDSGPGITPENGTHVFDPFFTTKSSGTGLGLSISRKIIADHGGELRLTKTGSNGCTFEITLPSVATNGKGSAGLTK